MEARSDVLGRLAATNPLPHGARIDPPTADELRASILAHPRRPTRRWTSNRGLRVAAVLVVLAAIVSPTLAFSDGVRSFLGWDSLPVYEKARLVVSAPVAESTVAHPWASPSRTGGECLFVTFGMPGEAEPPTHMTGGGVCSLGPRSKSGPPMWLTGSVSGFGTAPEGAAAGVPPLVEGYVNPNLDATPVEIRWNGGTKELTYANDYFLGGVRELFDPPPTVKPIRVIAYDAEGHKVAQHEIDPAWFRVR